MLFSVRSIILRMKWNTIERILSMDYFTQVIATYYCILRFDIFSFLRFLDYGCCPLMMYARTTYNTVMIIICNTNDHLLMTDVWGAHQCIIHARHETVESMSVPQSSITSAGWERDNLCLTQLLRDSVTAITQNISFRGCYCLPARHKRTNSNLVWVGLKIVPFWR